MLQITSKQAHSGRWVHKYKSMEPGTKIIGPWNDFFSIADISKLILYSLKT